MFGATACVACPCVHEATLAVYVVSYISPLSADRVFWPLLQPARALLLWTTHLASGAALPFPEAFLPVSAVQHDAC